MTETDVPRRQATVQIVEAERELADTYAVWLESEYVVHTTYSADEALTMYGPHVDIVLISQQIDTPNEHPIVERMASRDVDDQKVLLAETGPGCEFLHYSYDDHLRKPITKAELRDTVRELQLRRRLDDDIQRHFTVTSKLAALEACEDANTEVAVDELRREAEQLRAQIEGHISEFDEIAPAFSDR